MKTVLLAGGLGTRISEETQLKPKPMVEIGGIPILVHIMRCYAAHRFTQFVVALGYKGEVVKDYFLNYTCARATSRSTSAPARSTTAVASSRTSRWNWSIPETSP